MDKMGTQSLIIILIYAFQKGSFPSRVWEIYEGYSEVSGLSKTQYSVLEWNLKTEAINMKEEYKNQNECT